MSGFVYLVGAGPGDPKLITVRGAEVLGLADVVVFDRLASPALLELAGRAPSASTRARSRVARRCRRSEIDSLCSSNARWQERRSSG